VFAAEIVDLPDAWPACRTARCGSTSAVARIDVPFGPVVVSCENGHHRVFGKKADFRGRGRYAGLFSAAVLPVTAPRSVRERRLEPSERRRAEVLEDAERCALCGTPPTEHPYRSDAAVRTDAEIWSWLQRWRPALYARLLEALAIVRRSERVTFGNWRLKIPSVLRELVVGELSGSALQIDHLVPLVRLHAFLAELSPNELEFAVNRLVVAVCRGCNEGRWRQQKSREEYLREYVLALHHGEERLARAHAAEWRTMDAIATRAAHVRIEAEARTA
jgi:hypothetical protein